MVVPTNMQPNDDITAFFDEQNARRQAALHQALEETLLAQTEQAPRNYVSPENVTYQAVSQNLLDYIDPYRQTLMDDIKTLILNELKHAAELHGDHFASPHEAESVIREEIIETMEESARLERYMVVMQEELHNAHSIISPTLRQIETAAINIIEEALQVAAMVKKYRESEEIWQTQRR